MICFGPVPSRRLGKSLGINNIPSQKICSFSCRYCQLGITQKYSIARKDYYQPETIANEVSQHLNAIAKTDKPDYLTFISNGEPTLDINLGESIALLKQFNIPIAVITNASLLVNSQVRDSLNLADLVSVKVDANNKSTWEAINWPAVWLDFDKHVKGLLDFASEFKGKLITETMLVEGVNDSFAMVKQTSDLVKQLNPSIAYISIPTRPPAVLTVNAPSENTINEAYQIFTRNNINTELLIGFEGTETGFTGNAYEDIINICAVHPMREDTIMELLKKDNASINVLETLVQGKYVKRVQYKSNNYYLRQYHV